MLIDTHCHIHESDYPLEAGEVIERAHSAGVMQMICAGSNAKTSQEAVEFATAHDGIFASIGVHPHFAKDGVVELHRLIDSIDLGNGFVPIVAIGEIGLDYFYANSPREDQIKALEQQIDLAIQMDLPIIFHVRDGYDDFWPILDNFHGIRGVLHSFTDTVEHFERGLSRGFYIGVNGISTFTKIEAQKEMFAMIPVNRMLLETDAPFLTPSPLRGKIKVNEPAFVREIAEYTSSARDIPLDELAEITTSNARALFKL